MDRIILSNLWLELEDIKQRTGGQRVLWDRFWSNKRDHIDNQGSANFMSNRDTNSDTEALATLSGFQYQESNKSFYLEMLKTDISKHLISRLPRMSRTKTPTQPSLGQQLAPALCSRSSAAPVPWQGGSVSSWWTRLSHSLGILPPLRSSPPRTSPRRVIGATTSPR